MRARDVLGKRIVRIDQTRFYNSRLGKTQTAVERMVLEDGTVFWPVTIETEHGEYLHDFGVAKKRKANQ